MRTFTTKIGLLLLAVSGLLLPVQAQDVIWSTKGFSDEQGLPASSTYSYNGGTVTVSWQMVQNGGMSSYPGTSGSGGGGNDYVSYESTGAIGGINNTVVMAFDNVSNDPNDYVEVLYTFSEPQYGFKFTLLDIDTGTWDDGVEVMINGTTNLRENPNWYSFQVPRGYVMLDNQPGYEGFEGTSGNASDTDPRGNVICNVSGLAVTTLRYRFFSTRDADANPGGQKVGFSDLLVVKPELIHSTKTVMDQNGGTVQPGDTLRYTVAVTETAGNGAYATMNDVLPAELQDLAFVSIKDEDGSNVPYGSFSATGNSLSISGFYVPPTQSVFITYTAKIAESTEPGSTILNEALITEPFGSVNRPTAQITTGVTSPPQPPVTGNKPLYLHTTSNLSREQPTGTGYTEVDNYSSETWTLNPAMAADTTFLAGDLSVQLLMRQRGDNGYRRQFKAILLYDGDEVGRYDGYVDYLPHGINAIPEARTIIIPLDADLEIEAGKSLALRIEHETEYSVNRQIDIFPHYNGEYSFLSPNVETVINVDQMGVYSAAYPSTTQADRILAGETVYIRAVVSDPFGYDDINRAELTVSDPNGSAVVRHWFSKNEYEAYTDSTKVFEYAYIIPDNADPGTYPVSLTAHEGVENTIDHSGLTFFEVSSGPNLTESTKSVEDLNGGDAVPGDLLEYTVIVKESAGVAASGVQVTDVLPAGLQALSVVSVPDGAVDSSTASTLSISGISLPANGSATIVFRAQVAGGVPVGTTILNTANIIYEGATVASPSVSVVVQQSDPPVQGNKLLYLQTEGTPQISRTRPVSSDDNKQLFANNSSQTFTLNPAFALPTTLAAGNMEVSLLMTRQDSRTTGYSMEIEILKNSTVLRSTGVVGVNGLDATTPTPQVFAVNIPSDTAFAIGDTLTVRITNHRSGSNRRFYVHQLDGSDYSYISPLMQPVIYVESLAIYDASYSSGGGNAITTALPGETVYVRAVVSDPFGAFDINSAVLTATDPDENVVLSDQAMTEVASDASTKTYEYSAAFPSDATGGFWNVLVTAHEGTEGTVSHTRSGALQVLIPTDLSVLKVSYVQSDPVNGTSNPKRIPGAIVEYIITVQNDGAGGGDTDSIRLSDTIPPNTAMVVSDVYGASGPVEFDALTSGLVYSYPDDISFLNGSGVPFTPTPGADNTDAEVAEIVLNPKGTLNPSSQFSVRFRILLQ